MTYAHVAKVLNTAADELVREGGYDALVAHLRGHARVSEHFALTLDPLPKAQQRVLNFHARYIAKHGKSPTRAHVASQLGYASPNAVSDHLHALERKGRIEIGRDRYGGVTIL